MNDNVQKIKNELGRICRSSELTRIERYGLMMKQKELLDKIELNILIKELHRDYRLCERLKDLVEVITAFFNGITILLMILSIFYRGTGASSGQFGVVLLFVGFYVLFGIIAIWSIHWYKNNKLHRIQYMLDILEE